MTKNLTVALFLITLSHIIRAQTFTQSKLPIVIINTSGIDIPDEPKIDATMKIIYRGPGLDNFVADQDNPAYLNYNGLIGIELRGTTSQNIPKKPYGVETRRLNTTTNIIENQNVSLLGLPSENDWILNNIAFDQSYIRNHLVYKLSAAMGHYSSRTIFCEVIINDDYKGLYELQEKIKEDGSRVNIEGIESTDIALPNVTGGYITKADKTTGGDIVAFTMDSGLPHQPVQIVHDTPDPFEIMPEQGVYVESVFRSLETAANADNASLTDGFPSIIDIPTFIDFMLLNELASNVDAYQYSTYFHKDRNGKLRAGPVWDFNSSLGSDQSIRGGRSVTDKWQFNNGDNTGPLFFRQLFENTSFRCYLSKRWNNLTQSGQPFTLGYVQGILDPIPQLLAESVARDQQRWSYATVFNDELTVVTDFLSERISWMNDNLGGFDGCDNPSLPSLVINEIMYNPPGSSENQEFIEIKNTGATEVDLTGIYFSTLGISYQFPPGSSVIAGGFVVLASNAAGYTTQYGSAPFGEFTRKLPNGSHNLVLSDAFGNIIDQVYYYDSAPWPASADGGGKSLELKGTNLDNNVAANWFTRAADYGSPGEENFSPLPVTITRFLAKPEAQVVALKWEVASEIQIDHYSVEFSTNAKDFFPIGEVQATGNASYNFKHLHPVSGKNYYRLKSTETSGHFAYSKIVTAHISLAEETVFYPNPTSGLVLIRCNPDMINQKVMVSVFTQDGKKVYGKDVNVMRSDISMSLAEMPAGKYMISLESNGKTVTKQIDLVK